MRTLRELIDEVKFTANINRSTRYTDDILINYFNSAQRSIQRIIFNSNPEGYPFAAETTITVNGTTNEYELPNDVLVSGSVIDVSPILGDGSLAKPLKKVDLKERSNSIGYVIKGNKLIFTPIFAIRNYGEVFVTYSQIVPRMESVNDSPSLPEACEEWLMLYVERKIAYADSSSDVRTSGIFTEEERGDISELFADKSSDISYPVISSDIYYNY